MLDVLSLILSLRPELARERGFSRSGNRQEFLSWLITDGAREYKVVLEDPQLRALLAKTTKGKHLTVLQEAVLRRRPDVLAAFSLPDQLNEFLGWFYTHGVEECGIWPLLAETEKQRVLAQPEPWATRLSATINQHEANHEEITPFSHRKFGVNLIGYAFGQLGIGEDLRMAARALVAAKVPVCILNFPPGTEIPQSDYSMSSYVKDRGEYSINLFCLTAEETGRYYAERGSNQFKQRYNIGYWPWELPNWPKEWEMMLELVDEVWVSTQHIYDSLKPVCKKPLFIMPLAVQLGPVTQFKSREQARRNFRLPLTAKLFCFSFDLNSHIARKNPQACIDAFLQAFPVVNAARAGKSHKNTHAEVGLVIKTSKPSQRNRAWSKLKAQASKDPRIHIMEGTLQRADVLALYKACDCFLSLHRAEGFGRGLAEALLLGLHVICTGYSGNVDFCKPPHADLVRYKLVKVGKNDYVHTAGQKWAEPSVSHAAMLMQNFVAYPQVKRTRLWKEFSLETIGKNYLARLKKISEIASLTPSPFRDQ